MNARLEVGHIVNPIPFTRDHARPVADGCDVRIPSRVDTFLCRTQFLSRPVRPLVHPVESLNFAIAQYSRANLRLNTDRVIRVTGPSRSRQQIVLHAALMMKQVLGFREGLDIWCDNDHDIVHGGLASTASLASATAIGINGLYGNQVPAPLLIKLIAQNYGEESEEQGVLTPIPSIGGAVASALLSANVVAMTDETCVGATHTLPADYRAVLWIPEVGDLPGGAEDQQLYEQGKATYAAMGQRYGDLKHAILHREIIPALARGDTRPLFTQINRYTAGAYGDIPGYFGSRWIGRGVRLDRLLPQIEERIFGVSSPDEACVFVSSGGPTVVIITRRPRQTIDAISSLPSRAVYTTPLHAVGPRLRLHVP